MPHCITFAPFPSPVINDTDVCMVVWRRRRFEVTFDEIRRPDDKLFGAKVHALAVRVVCSVRKVPAVSRRLSVGWALCGFGWRQYSQSYIITLSRHTYGIFSFLVSGNCM